MRLNVADLKRCLLRDLGTPAAAVRYAERVAMMQGADADDYAQAARELMGPALERTKDDARR
jgi:hypothetical protein